VALHLACIGRGGKVHFHASGIRREIDYILVERIGNPKRWINRNPKVKTAKSPEPPDAVFLPASLIRKPKSNSANSVSLTS
jgi:hypothetical protein